ncbi:site-specific integrase [Aromatoleum aromaticum]|uniref:site-specific integrase n=1 Tax=Aromatoleum aromaticum TaxID=551760 RepID=UPI001459C77F|nr:hypothetical protein [Aromatoleum aromaticum]
MLANNVDKGIPCLGTAARSFRDRLRLKHHSLCTGQAYVYWVKRYIIHDGRRHPKDMRKQEGEAFQTSLAAERDVRAATQGQGLSAIQFAGRCWSTLAMAG